MEQEHRHRDRPIKARHPDASGQLSITGLIAGNDYIVIPLMMLRRWFLIRNQAFATIGPHDVSGIPESGRDRIRILRRELRIFGSEIVTPDGAQPSVLLNDGLDRCRYAAELVSAPCVGDVLSLDGMALLSTKGRFRRHSLPGQEWGAYVGPASISVTISAASAPESSIVKVSVSRLVVRCRIKALNGSAWSSVGSATTQADGLRSNHDRTSTHGIRHLIKAPVDDGGGSSAV